MYAAQQQNTLPLWREKSSGSIVLYGNRLFESVVNKPLSFLSSDHSCHTYSGQRKQISLLCPETGNVRCPLR